MEIDTGIVLVDEVRVTTICNLVVLHETEK